MKPLRIYLKNFMNHSESEIDCTRFSSSLIVGKTKDNDRISNGVGKTTIYNAIEWVLYNQSHKTNLDKIVREGKKKAIVEFDFEIDGQRYRAYRHRTVRGSSDSRLYKWNGSAYEDICERTPSATDKKLREDIMRISHKAFTYIVLFRQADLTGLSAVQDPKKRREIMKEPFELTSYSKLEKMQAKKVSLVKKEIEKIESAIAVIGNPDADIKKAQQELEVVKVEAALKEKKIKTDILDTINDKKKMLQELKSSLNAEDADIHNKASEQKQLVSSLNREIGNLNSQITEHNESLVKIRSSIMVARDGYESAQSDLSDFLKVELRPLEEVKAKLAKVSADEVYGSSLISETKAKLKNEKNTIPHTDECPLCLQKIDEAHRQAQITKINKKIKTLQADLDQYEDSLIKCKRKKSKLEQEVEDVLAHQSKLIQAKNEVKRMEDKVHALSESMKSREASLANLESALSRASSKLEDAMRLFEDLRKASSESNVADINQKMFAIEEEISMYEKSRDSLYAELGYLRQREGGLQERISSRNDDKKKLDVLNEKLKMQRKEYKIRKMAVEAWSPNGIPRVIIQTMLDELNNETNKALSELRPELSVEMDIDFNILYFRNGEPREYGQLSHGQHVYISLAFKRGIAQVIQKKMGVDLRMLQFDEVDSHLDAEGVDAFSDCIKKWQKDFTIFVITHNENLKDKFNHVIMVEEGDDGSSAKLVDSWS